jgi:flagellar biosynthesis protein FliQ
VRKARIKTTRQHQVFGGHQVSGSQALELLTQFFWNAELIAAPVLITTLAVGLIASVIQIVTQLQEVTLNYVPKVAAGSALRLPMTLLITH